MFSSTLSFGLLVRRLELSQLLFGMMLCVLELVFEYLSLSGGVDLLLLDVELNGGEGDGESCFWILA
jgi:hypothetical protein